MYKLTCKCILFCTFIFFLDILMFVYYFSVYFLFIFYLIVLLNVFFKNFFLV